MYKTLCFVILNLFISIAWANKPVTQFKCEITEKLFQNEFEKVLKRPVGTAQTLWNTTLKKPLRRSRARELAEELRYLRSRFFRKLKRRAKKSLKNNTPYDLAEDRKMDRLQEKIQKAEANYNNYVLKNLRSSFAKKVKTVHENGAYFNFAHNDDPGIEFKSDLFTNDLDIKKNQKLNLEFFDRRDINGSLYKISYNELDPKIIEISKKDNDESVALSGLITDTISDGSYYSVTTNYQFKLGKKNPEVQYVLSQYNSEEAMDKGEYPKNTRILKQDELLAFVGTSNCQNGFAINQIPKIVNDTERNESKTDSVENGSTPKSTSKEVIKN